MFALRHLPKLATKSFPVVRTLSTSLPRFSVPEPIILGEGGKTGEVPTDLEQATGLERFELLYRLRGEEAFSTEPLQVMRMGTVVDPIMVFSLDDTRIIGCSGFPVDSHDNILFTIDKGKTTRCPECGCGYKVDFQGSHDDHHH